MEEAQRLLTVSVWKLYRCRLQRGGLRLHRSLQLSLLVRAARHRYLSARAAAAAAAAAEPGTSPEMATGDLSCAPAPNRGAPSVRPMPEHSDRPSGDPSDRSIPNPSNRSIPNPSNRPTGNLSNQPVPDPSNRPTGNPSNQPVPDPSDRPTGNPFNQPVPDPSDRPTGNLSNQPVPDPSDRPIPEPSNRTTGTPFNQPVPNPCSAPDRGDLRDPHRAAPPSPPAPYRGDQHIRNASDRGELPSPDPANRDHPRDHPQDSPNRDLPSAAAAAAPSPEPLQPLGPLPPARAGRKRRSSGSATDGPVPVPSKRARLEAEEPPLPPGGPPGRCLAPLPAAFSLLIRAVGAC